MATQDAEAIETWLNSFCWGMSPLLVYFVGFGPWWLWLMMFMIHDAMSFFVLCISIPQTLKACRASALRRREDIVGGLIWLVPWARVATNPPMHCQGKNAANSWGAVGAVELLSPADFKFWGESCSSTRRRCSRKCGSLRPTKQIQTWDLTTGNGSFFRIVNYVCDPAVNAKWSTMVQGEAPKLTWVM